MTTGSRVPNGLKAAGRRLWLAALENYEFDVHEELLLLQACRTADRLDRLAIEAEANDVTTANRFGELVAHPALIESRQQSITLARLLAALRMPAGEDGGELAVLSGVVVLGVRTAFGPSREHQAPGWGSR